MLLHVYMRIFVYMHTCIYDLIIRIAWFTRLVVRLFIPLVHDLYVCLCMYVYACVVNVCVVHMHAFMNTCVVCMHTRLKHFHVAYPRTIHVFTWRTHGPSTFSRGVPTDHPCFHTFGNLCACVSAYACMQLCVCVCVCVCVCAYVCVCIHT